MLFNRLALVATVITFAACGGGSDSAPAAESTPAPASDAAAPAAAPAGDMMGAAPITGTIHEVKMLGDDKGFRFEPAQLTIKAGDGVKFVAVSGFPHNVAFVGTALSADVKKQLDVNFGTNRMGELMSNMYLAENEGFTLSFGNIPAGTYEFNCTPHIAMGMKGVITVQ